MKLIKIIILKNIQDKKDHYGLIEIISPETIAKIKLGNLIRKEIIKNSL